LLDDSIRRLSKPVPRYTSYPTAPHFHESVTADTYRGWLSTLSTETALSLYLHIPFCDRLCWFCGCHTKQVLRYDPIAAYLQAMHREIETVATCLGGRGNVSHIHLGGGSPSMLTPRDLITLNARLRSAFGAGDLVEFSIEIDPNDLTADRYDGLAAVGVTRASIGVQDFDPKVQQAINRIQTFEQTRAAVDALRASGIPSINLDVLYGLPFQTGDSLRSTLDAVLALQPDRVALFGYAHVPWMKTHQKMIDESALPDVVERYHQARFAADKLTAAGYESIGMDHFARSDDHLASAARSGRLHRNFQGYTTDDAPALVGLGASAIGALPQGYVQNVVPTAEYMRRVNGGELATVRGYALTDDDRIRRYIIEQLMCYSAVSIKDLEGHFGAASAAIVDEIRTVGTHDDQGLVCFDGEILAMTEQGRPFVRVVAARFDAYLQTGQKRHSVPV